MILPDWFWYLEGPNIVEPFNPDQVNPTSYDLRLDRYVILQVYQGRVYNLRGYIDGSSIYLDNGGVLPNYFYPGDSVLASTFEEVHVPKLVRLQGMLKSSLARAGINHRTALYIDPGFKGPITLELQFDLPGKLVAYKPIIQVEAQLVFPLKAYSGRYNGQERPQPNLNEDIAFVPHL